MTLWAATSAAVFSLLLTATACKKTTAPATNVVNQTSPALSPEELRQQRLAWNLKTLVEPYENAGFANPAWDAPAKLALTEFARARAKVLDDNEPSGQIIAKNAAAAVQAGCKDPMVTYLYIKFAMDQTNSKEAFTHAFVTMARTMNNSPYPPIRKFYAAIRTVDQLFFTYGTNSMSIPAVLEIEPWVAQNLMTTLQDKTMPAVEAYEVGKEALKQLNWDTNNYAHAYSCIEKPLFANWPDAYSSWLLKGEAYYQMGWNARGGGYATNVSEQGWQVFFNNLAIAGNALTNAWNINSNDERIPIQMIKVAEGAQKHRAEMEAWFNHAMTINPNCYEACEDKLHYLYPQWYGSRADMVSFGRECVASTNWGGIVPLILADAHREYWLYAADAEIKTNYWKRPDVWPDIQAAFEKFFTLNPNAISYNHNYAWFAYKCEQWDKLNELIPKLGVVNYDYFGGKNEFSRMVQLTKEHVSNPK